MSADPERTDAVSTPLAAPRTVGPHWLANLFPPKWKEYLGSDWDAKLDAIQKLLEEAEKTFGPYNPAKEDIFNAFWACSPEKVKAIFLLIDPVQEEGMADGLALSAPPGTATGPTILHMIEALKLSRRCGYVRQEGIPSLLCCAQQGVLLLNKYLTVPRQNKGGKSQSTKHAGVWGTFVTDVIIGLIDEKMKRYHASRANSTAPSDTPSKNPKSEESSAVALAIFAPESDDICKEIAKRPDVAELHFGDVNCGLQARVGLYNAAFPDPTADKEKYLKSVNCFSTINNFLTIHRESPVDWNFLEKKEADKRWKGFCSKRNRKISELQQHSI